MVTRRPPSPRAGPGGGILLALLVGVLVPRCGETDSGSSSAEGGGTQGAPPAAAPDAAALDLVRSHLRSNRVLQAISILDDALAAWPEWMEARMLLGQALLRESADQDVEEAVEEFQKVAAAGQRDAQVWMAKAYAQLGRWEDAGRSVQAFLGGEPVPTPAPSALYADAAAIEARRRLQAGQAQGVAALVQTLRRVAEEQLRGGADVLVQRRLQMLLLDSDAMMVEVLLLTDRADKAHEGVQVLMQRWPERVSVRRLAARVCEATEQAEEAARHERVAELLESFTDALYTIAVSLEELEAQYLELAQAEPPIPRLPLSFARGCISRREFSRAVELCRSLRAQLEDGPAGSALVGESWFVEGLALRRSSDRLLDEHPDVPALIEQSIECFRQSAAIDPGFLPDFRMIEGKLRERLGRIEAQGPADDG